MHKQRCRAAFVSVRFAALPSEYMDYKLLLDTAVMAGELMLENGAETYRVEDTMHRILSLSDLKIAEVFVTMTGFVATLDDPSIDSMTVVRRISSRSTNLDIIHRVNTISREFCTGNISLKDAFHEIRDIKRTPSKPRAFLFSTTVITASFTLTFGGGFWEIVVSAMAGFLMALCLYLCRRCRMQNFLSMLLSAAVLSASASLGARLLPVPGTLDNIVIGAIMPLVPGVAITNAVFDTLNGDYLSGIARTLEAFVIAAAVAIGIGLGLGI